MLIVVEIFNRGPAGTVPCASNSASAKITPMAMPILVCSDLVAQYTLFFGAKYEIVLLMDSLAFVSMP